MAFLVLILFFSSSLLFLRPAVALSQRGGRHAVICFDVRRCRERERKRAGRTALAERVVSAMAFEVLLSFFLFLPPSLLEEWPSCIVCLVSLADWCSSASAARGSRCVSSESTTSDHNALVRHLFLLLCFHSFPRPFV